MDRTILIPIGTLFSIYTDDFIIYLGNENALAIWHPNKINFETVMLKHYSQKNMLGWLKNKEIEILFEPS